MDQVVVFIALILFGASLGSFAAATVWRLRARQLLYDKEHKEPYDKAEYSRLKKLLGKGALKDRSRCLECGYELRWYDLIPIVSWVALRGKCRSCKHPIGWFELFMELGVAAFFVVSYLLWPGGFETTLDGVHFALWLIAGVIMAILFAYDLKWLLLPNGLNFTLAVVGAAIVAVAAAQSSDALSTILSAVGSVGVLAGLYGLLYFASGGRWVGFGDVKLGVGLGLLLIDWRLALVAVFLANLIGCLIVIPLMATKKLKRNTQIPFGPLLIAGAIAAWFIGYPLLDAYLGILSI